jgi:hypothetical protein
MKFITGAFNIQLKPVKIRDDYGSLIDSVIDLISNDNNNRFPAQYQGTGDDRGESIDISPANCPNRNNIILYGKEIVKIFGGAYKLAKQMPSQGVIDFLKSIDNAT